MQQLDIKELDNSNLDEESEKLTEDLRDLNEISILLSNMVSKQQENLTKIKINVDSSTTKTQQGHEEIVLSNHYYQGYKYAQGLYLTTGVLVATCPIGLILGLKAGIISGIVTTSYSFYKYYSS